MSDALTSARLSKLLSIVKDVIHWHADRDDGHTENNKDWLASMMDTVSLAAYACRDNDDIDRDTLDRIRVECNSLLNVICSNTSMSTAEHYSEKLLVLKSDIERALEVADKHLKRANGRQEPLCLDKVFVAIGSAKESFQKRVKTIAPWFEWNDYSWSRLETEIMMKTGHNPDSLQSLTMQELTGVIDAVMDQTNKAKEKPEQVSINHVTLRQCAGIVKKSKRTLERWKTDDMTFPTPEVFGNNGSADEWLWTTIKPYLETKSDRKLPSIFPAHVAR